MWGAVWGVCVGGVRHLMRVVAPIGLSPLTLVFSFTPFPLQGTLPRGSSPPSALDLPVRPALTRRTERGKGPAEGCDVCPCEGSGPAIGHPRAQPPPLGRGPPPSGCGGVRLEAPGQRRGPVPSPVRTRHGAVEQGQSGGWQCARACVCLGCVCVCVGGCVKRRCHTRTCRGADRAWSASAARSGRLFVFCVMPGTPKRMRLTCRCGGAGPRSFIGSAGVRGGYGTSASYRKAPTGVARAFCLNLRDEDLHSATVVGGGGGGVVGGVGGGAVHVVCGVGGGGGGSGRVCVGGGCTWGVGGRIPKDHPQFKDEANKSRDPPCTAGPHPHERRPVAAVAHPHPRLPCNGIPSPLPWELQLKG